jgi:glycosyltransferase involved in cell wall biosynthesis
MKKQSKQGKWICCQIGAREHYAVPRVMHSIDSLGGLITETWVPPGHLVRLISRLGERFHAELNLAPVYAWNSATIAFELSARLHRLGGWPLTLKRNQWFQQRSLEVLSRLAPQFEYDGNRPILFAYSYAAIELLRFAKARGWKAILGQIDGGICDEEIIANEHQQRTGVKSHWQQVPSEYWCSWKEECALADTIIVNSNWSKELLIDAGIDAAKLQTIPVAYEAEAEAQRFERIYPIKFSEARPLRILFLGAFALRKGAAAVLEAISLLENEPIEFWIVGSIGVDIPSAFRESPKVKWIGSVSRESTADFYRNADLFLFPTISDGFGMTQVEARGWKLPIIATPFCAPIVQHEINGLVVTEVTGESLKNAIRHLLNNPIYLKQLSEGSAEEYEAYSFASVREKILSLGI